MKEFKTLNLMAWLTAVIFLLTTSNLFAQRGWKVGLGNTFTNYNFLSSKGLKADYFKLGSGNSAFISSEKPFLDTVRFIGGTDSKSVFFQKNKVLSKFLSKLHYELGVSYNQYNSLGNIQGFGFQYQTNFIGLFGGVGLVFPIYGGFSLGIKGKSYAQQMLQGTQELNAQFTNLQQDSDFNKPTIFVGGAIEINKQVNSNIILFIQADRYNSIKSVETNVKSLNFSAINASLGIKFIP